MEGDGGGSKRQDALGNLFREVLSNGHLLVFAGSKHLLGWFGAISQ